MNKIILIIVSILIIIFIAVFTTYKVLFSKNPKELALRYDISAGIPFKWEFEIEDESIVEFVRTKEVSNANKGGLVGGKIVTDYIFKGLKPGETTITFKFVNFSSQEDRVDSETKHTIIVDENLNISEKVIKSEK